MKMNVVLRQASLFCLTLVATCMVLNCRDAKTSPDSDSLKPVTDLQPLIFPASDNVHSSPSAERTDTVGWGNAKAFLSTTRNFDSALSHFNRYRAAAVELDIAEEWFAEFIQAVQVLGSDSKRDALAQEWVADALHSTDLKLRTAISRSLGQFIRKYSPNFYLRQNKLRPGDFLEVDGYGFGEGKRKGISLRLEKAALDSNLHPLGFAEVADTTLHSTEEVDRQKWSSWRYRHRLDSVGIYRLVMSGPYYFEEQYFQVSDLDLMVKNDGSKLLVWGSSFQNHLPAPYDVYVWNAQFKQVHVRSDKTGIGGLFPP
jgi:hypothetical protein